MRKYLLLLLLFPSLTHSASIESFDPVSHWLCDEVSGVRYDSVITNANDLSDINTVTSDVGALELGCVFVATNSERLEDTTLTLTDNELITISFWLKSSNFSTTPGTVSLAPASTGTRNDITIRPGPDVVSVGIRWRVGSTDYSLEPSAYTATDNDDDTFHHYVLVLQNISGLGNLKLYYDGVEVGDATHATQPFAFPTWTKIRLGAHFNNFNSSYVYLTGMLDEVTLFDQALDESAVSVLYNSGTPLFFEQSTAATSSDTILVYAEDDMMSGTTTCVATASGTTCVTDTLGLSGLSLFGLLLAVIIIASTGFIIWILRA